MTALSEARAALAVALADSGYEVEDHVPEQIEPPLVVVQPADEYLSQEDTTYDVTEWAVRVDLFLLAGYRSNAQAADDLDAMLTAVLPRISAAGWNLVGMGSPGPYNTADWIAHGVRATVQSFVEIPTAGTA